MMRLDPAADAATLVFDERRAGRHRVMLAARLLTPHASQAVALLDLSAGGAMLSTSSAVPRDAPVVLVRGRLEAHGRVAWTSGRRIGLEFDEALDEATVISIVSPVIRNAH